MSFLQSAADGDRKKRGGDMKILSFEERGGRKMEDERRCVQQGRKKLMTRDREGGRTRRVVSRTKGRVADGEN